MSFSTEGELFGMNTRVFVLLAVNVNGPAFDDGQVKGVKDCALKGRHENVTQNIQISLMGRILKPGQALVLSGTSVRQNRQIKSDFLMSTGKAGRSNALQHSLLASSPPR